MSDSDSDDLFVYAGKDRIQEKCRFNEVRFMSSQEGFTDI